MDSPSSSQGVKTRFLIISDTHGMSMQAEYLQHEHIDIAIHCGDLTTESKLSEYRSAIQLLRQIPAPLKLIIAGNHDFTLDDVSYSKKITEAESRGIDINLIHKEFGDHGEARELIEEAKDSGILFLDEGNYHFELSNGAALRVYASPYTPSLGDWGFQYRQGEDHAFSMDMDVDSVDVVITHGPPRGIMDYTDSGQRAGCPHLFEAVARCRPRMHCFGHIHEAWGAKLVTWQKTVSERPSHFTDIDNGKSEVLAKLSTLSQGDETLFCCATSHCSKDTTPVQRGLQTLFVNAAIEGTEDRPIQLPWLVDLDLPYLA
ncbi:ser/Thr protein phosphatase family protein [Aspergillus ellipticus CBS 707.79]|uniref:Ser/Thr protein phosphatase family protein n=1 Tax=Aspergillus ellipticus CBS 707.79 TaxID=1448320 RepID=A0A319E584_9EURO|nr:ser/Thr protein phosphatase family protein [Aspergillus ellipticus CBS 707.79]